MASTFSIESAREKFPALLTNDQVFFDNAGGSQTLGTVIQSISAYLSSTNVQLGASYAVGQQSTKLYGEGYQAAADYINADRSEVVLGSSTTQLFRNLSWTLSFPAGSEIIISKLDHEANIAPWMSLAARQSLTIKWWAPPAGSTTNPKLQADDLKGLLTAQTKLVSLTHASNILGTIHDVKAITSYVHANSTALVVVDAVAYAPHRRLDVKDLGVDFYSFSWYKVYGPHLSILYASRKAQESIASLGHFFNANETLEDKLGLAGGSYELVHSIPAILKYLDYGNGAEKESWKRIVEQEGQLQGVLLGYLKGRGDVTIYGEESADTEKRVATVSFKVKGIDSGEVVRRVEEKTHFGFRCGKFYSDRLVGEVLALGKDGVVRVSMVHYNTVDEIKEFVTRLDELIPVGSGESS